MEHRWRYYRRDHEQSVLGPQRRPDRLRSQRADRRCIPVERTDARHLLALGCEPATATATTAAAPPSAAASATTSASPPATATAAVSRSSSCGHVGYQPYRRRRPLARAVVARPLTLRLTTGPLIGSRSRVRTGIRSARDAAGAETSAEAVKSSAQTRSARERAIGRSSDSGDRQRRSARHARPETGFASGPSFGQIKSYPFAINQITSGSEGFVGAS